MGLLLASSSRSVLAGSYALRTTPTELFRYGASNPLRFGDRLGLSKDKYVPDATKHGGPHVDRYTKDGRNVGRYRPDGSPVKFKGKIPPRIPNSDWARFCKAAAKLGGKALLPGLVILDEILFNPSPVWAGEGEWVRRTFGPTDDFVILPPGYEPPEPPASEPPSCCQP